MFVYAGESVRERKRKGKRERESQLCVVRSRRRGG